jgi:beta-aspartyl-peptidase (threonine type)
MLPRATPSFSGRLGSHGMASLFVHGGVTGSVRPITSLRAAFADISGRALDMVERAIRALEDLPELNAGYGAVLDREGRFELEAGLVDGTSGRTAGVTNVVVRHPITLARRVLERTPHVLLTGDGARAFGADLETLEDTTPEQLARWEKARTDGTLDLARYGAPEQVDTVGAVALDEDGDLAAGSSTGGVFGMLPGRVGDAPIFGAGMYASRDAAVVGTGVGELFLETLASARVGRMVEDGVDPQRACEKVIVYLGTRARYPAGLLAIDADGRPGAAYRGATWAVEGSGGPLEAARLE